MSKRLEGKVAVVTGAASGLGAATAARFAAEGARVVLADLQIDKAEALAASLPGAVAIKTNVTVEDDVAAAVALAVSRFGRLDIMVNNAGILGVTGPIATLDGRDFLRTMDILFTSVFYGIKHAAPHLIAQRSGCILNTASTAGVYPALAPHAYTAAKHAVVGLTKSAAAELAFHSVRVNAVAPGLVPTAFTSQHNGGLTGATEASAARSPLGRALDPNDVAEAYTWFASDAGQNITGQVLVLDGGQAFRHGIDFGSLAGFKDAAGKN